MKKAITKIICTILIVAVLSVSVGSKYFDANHMEKVDAVGTVVVAGGITLATLAEICLFVGTTALAAYGLYEGYENREEIARFGKEFIDSCGDTAEGWVMQIVDSSGQDYVFGSEALELVRDTEWTVLQGGLPPEGDPNNKDDKDKDKFHIPGDPMTHVAQFTALGATWFTTNAKGIYQDWCDILDGWVGKDTPIPQNNVLANNFPKGFTSYDDIQTIDGKFNISGYARTSVSLANDYNTWSANNISVNEKVCLVYSSNGNSYLYNFYSLDRLGYIYNITLQKGYHAPGTDRYWNDTNSSISSNYPISLSFNIPIFSSYDVYAEAFNSGDYSSASNYVKDYRIADWLQQDWGGELIDPLVNIGLNLSQLIDLMKALGLKTMQGLDAADLLDLLKNALPKINPELNPGAVPALAVDPALDPIYYPEPDAYPDKPPRPVIDPGQTIEPDPTPTPDPTPEPSPDPIDIPIPEVVPTVESSFGDIAGSIRYKFPFSIPWDLHYLFEKMANTPKAPYFELPIVIERYGIDEKIIVDMKRFQKLSNMSRTLFSLIFVLGLIKLTMLVVGMRKEE